MAVIVGDASKARFFAHFIDQLAALGVAILPVVLVPLEYPTVKLTLFVAMYVAYFVPCEALWSRTLGKFVQGLVIRKLDGSPCGWKAAFIRFALRLVEVNPMILGDLPAAITILATKRRQRLGDLLAGTVVVRSTARFKPSPPRPTPEKVEAPVTSFERSHIWLGQFGPEAPEDFFEEQYGREDDSPLSQFAASQGETWYDHDFVEFSFLEKMSSVRSLVEGYSYCDSYLDAVAAQAAALGIEGANVFILADKEQFAAPRSASGPGYQLWYLGEFECATK